MALKASQIYTENKNTRNIAIYVTSCIYFQKSDFYEYIPKWN